MSWITILDFSIGKVYMSELTELQEQLFEKDEDAFFESINMREKDCQYMVTQTFPGVVSL